jgi:hypothetical protein
MISGLSQTFKTIIRARWGGGGDEARQRQCFKDRVLHYIAASGFRTAVKIALAAGADVNSQSDPYLNQERYINLAIIYSPPEQIRSLVRILLEYSTKLKLKTFFRGTLLYYTGKSGQGNTVDLLL